MKSKRRLDLLLVERGLAPTREKAQALILAGLVEVDGRPGAKAGASFDASAEIAVAGPPHPYVSRGGVKLAAALDHFAIDPAGLVCLDVGASTGGFTDCLLQRGAARVYAVDVGHGQLDARLRADPRVVVREKVNARRSRRRRSPSASTSPWSTSRSSRCASSCPRSRPLAKPGAALVTLVKPQFEAGRGEVPRGGVVRSEEVRRRVVAEIEEAGRRLGLAVLGSIRSPIRGARGNEEFLLGFRVN